VQGNEVKRAPKQPRDSPLFSKGEQKLLNKLTKFVFQNAETFSNDWKATVTRYGYQESIDSLRTAYQRRYMFQQNFASVTSSRLREFRDKLNLDQSKKKVEMST